MTTLCTYLFQMKGNLQMGRYRRIGSDLRTDPILVPGKRAANMGIDFRNRVLSSEVGNPVRTGGEASRVICRHSTGPRFFTGVDNQEKTMNYFGTSKQHQLRCGPFVRRPFLTNSDRL
jgi:hypothetical protein